MDEGRAEQERQPIISNLFPISEQSVLTAFKKLSPRENPSGAQEEETKELGLMRKTNPHVLASFDDLLESQAPKKADQMRLGSLICNRALREEANARGGILPALKRDFVEHYVARLERKLEDELKDKGSLMPDEIGPQIRRANINKFRNHEPEFSKIVEEKFVNQPNWLPEDDFRYIGLTYQYLLFREGYKNPKNFQQ